MKREDLRMKGKKKEYLDRASDIFLVAGALFLGAVGIAAFRGNNLNFTGTGIESVVVQLFMVTVGVFGLYKALFGLDIAKDI